MSRCEEVTLNMHEVRVCDVKGHAEYAWSQSDVKYHAEYASEVKVPNMHKVRRDWCNSRRDWRNSLRDF